MQDHCTVRIVRGPRAGATLPLSTGLARVVGRDASASLQIDDEMASRAHFELLWDGHQCTLRDLGSLNGTTVNGHRVTHVVVGAGDLIVAGDTELMLEIGTSPSPAASQAAAPLVPQPAPRRVATPPVQEPRVEPSRDALIRVMRDLPQNDVAPAFAAPLPGSPAEWSVAAAAKGLRVFAVVDATGGLETLRALARDGYELFALFVGTPADTAPMPACLVCGDDPGALATRWQQDLADRGVLVCARGNAAALARHLAGVLEVTSARGDRYVLPLAEPETLRRFLAACPRERLPAFFGPVKAWLARTDQGLCAFGLDGSDLGVEPLEP